MSNSTRIDRRSALVGGAVGVAALAVLGVASGLGAGGLAGDRVVSWGNDGRQAYLWAIDGDTVRFLSSARANEPGNDDKSNDKTKGKGDDAGAGGSGKDKDKDKGGKDNAGGQGKGKGNGGG